MKDEIMETEVVEKENKGLIFTSNNGNSFQISDEKTDELFKLAGEMGKEYVQAKKEALMAELQREAEIQVAAMEKTATGQKNVLDAHERIQHHLLEKYTVMREKCLDRISKSQTPEERTVAMSMLGDINKELETFYLDNNKKLDSSLEQVKQKPKGIIGQFLSRLGL